MEVLSPVERSPDFHFNNSPFSSYTTAPSSPTPFGDTFNYQYQYTSAPASPTRAAAIYSELTASAYPTSSPRRPNNNGRYHQPVGHRSPEGRILRPLQESGLNSLAGANSTRNGRRASRSLSPSRDEGLLAKNTRPSVNPVKCGLSRKWPRLKDLLLFRSASEGRASGRGSKDPLQKYTALPSVSSVSKKREGEDKKTGGGGVEAVRRGGGPAVSAHEKHYMANRAAAEEQKRKTPLPFQRHGLLGLVHLNTANRGKNKANGATSVSKGRV